MRLALSIAVMMLCACAETNIYDNGVLVACVQGDCQNITIQTQHVYFHADSIIHSTPTAATYTGVTQIVGGIGAGVATGLLAHP